MLNHQSLRKVSVDVYKKNCQFFTSVDLGNLYRLLGPASSCDEIYHLVFSFISDLCQVAEMDNYKQGRSINDLQALIIIRASSPFCNGAVVVMEVAG